MKPMMIVVRFENVHTDEILMFGPFDFVQLTYELLRVGPDGDDIAVINEDNDWILQPDQLARERYPYLEAHAGKHFSDVIIVPWEEAA